MQHMGKRLGAAALATQMLFAPAAQAAVPLREMLGTAELRSSASEILEGRTAPRAILSETFPRLKLLLNRGDSDRLVAVNDVEDDHDQIEALDASAQDAELETDGADNEAPAKDTDGPADVDHSGKDETTSTAPDKEQPAETQATATDETERVDTSTEIDDKVHTQSDDNTSQSDATTPADERTDTSVDKDGDEDTTIDVDTSTSGASENEEATDADASTNEDGDKHSLQPFYYDPSDLSYAYLDCCRVLAIFGFGSDYRFPEMPLESGDKYKYNIESPLAVEGDADTDWVNRRAAGMGYELVQQQLGGNATAEWELRDGFASAYGQIYSAPQAPEKVEWGGWNAALNGADDNFKWTDNSAGDWDKQVFTGTLPSKPNADGSLTDYESKFDVRMPRLPNKEFTGEWYVLGSQRAREKFTGGTIMMGVTLQQDVTVDGVGATINKGIFPNMIELYTHRRDQDAGIFKQHFFYQDLEYDPVRDTKQFSFTDVMDGYLYDDDDSESSFVDPDNANFVAQMDSYRPYMDTEYPTTLPLIGRWKLSSNADLTAMRMDQIREGQTENMVLYPMRGATTVSSMTGMTYYVLHQQDSGFETETTRYFARLPYTVTALTWNAGDIESYEPGSTIKVTPKYTGVASTSVPVYTLVGTESVEYDNGKPNNSVDAPARGLFALESGKTIPVTFTSGGVVHGLEQLTFAVTPPDGSAPKEYIIYFEQLKDPAMEQGPGNTPMGMIYRNVTDPSVTGHDPNYLTWTKVAAENNLRTWYSFRQGANNFFPADSISNNQGNIWRGTYYANAWGNQTASAGPVMPNLDMDVGAIIVYPNRTFDVPGFSIYNAQGTKLSGSTTIQDPHTGAAKPSVKWELELMATDKLSPKLMTDVAPAEVTLVSDKMSGDGNVGTLSLVGHNIKPGIYTLKYTYTDPFDGFEHAGGTFDRPVVVLPLHGDVDMDGIVTPADGIALQNILADPSMKMDKAYVDTCTDVIHSLYFYRVCDIDGNGAVNATDVDLLLCGYKPELKGSTAYSSDYFYLPLSASGSSGSIDRDYAAVTNSSSDPAFSLAYAGAGVDAPTAGSPIDFDIDTPSVFWMEVRLDNASSLSAAQGTLTMLTMTLTYDNDYVVPYTPSGVEWKDHILAVNPQWAGWELKLSAQKTGIDIVPETDVSKAVSRTEGTLRELHLTLVPGAGAVNANPLIDASLNGSVLQVPFRLKSMPTGKSGSTMQLVDLSLGPRDLVLTTTNNGVSQTALWDNHEAEYNIPTGASTATSNINLASIPAYGGSEKVELGEDLTPVYYVYINTFDYSSTEMTNLVYGYTPGATGIQMWNYGVRKDSPNVEAHRAAFPANAAITWADASVASKVSYSPQYRELYVTGQLDAGEYHFTFAGSTTPFCMVVEKSVLTLTVKDARKYYGETAATDFEYTYVPGEIKSPDLGRGNNSGKGADLGSVIEGFTPPVRRLLTAVDGDAVTAVTPPGDYIVTIQGAKSKNYDFKYKRADLPAGSAGSVSTELGTAKLTVLPRPIIIDKITRASLGTLKDNGPYIALTGYALTGTVKQDELSFAALTNHTSLIANYVGGKIDGVPITGDAASAVVGDDVVEISFSAEVVRTAADEAGVGFALTQETESRDAQVNEIDFTTGAGNNNDRYVLMNKKIDWFDVNNRPIVIMRPVDRSSQATIVKRRMSEIVVRDPPERMNYLYGQPLSLEGALITVFYGAEDDQNQTRDTLKNMRTELGLEIYWVDSDTAVPTAASPLAKDGEEITVAYHNGKYLCLTDAATQSVRAYIGPITVEKRLMTLTIRTETRYYGETIAHWDISYNPAQLATWDRRDNPENSGKIEELTWMTDFVAPTVIPRETNTITGRPVTATTDVTDDDCYYSVFSNASAADYTFEYTRTTTSGVVGQSADFGYAPLKIERRPILVTKILVAAGSMYHDTDSYEIKPARAVVGGNAAGYTSILPELNKRYSESDHTAYTWDGRWPLSGSAVHPDDTLTVLYDAEFLNRDNDQKPFYTLRGDEPSRTVPVQVTHVRLSGERSKNYILLFPNGDPVNNGWAGETETASRTTGTIFLRKIEGLELIGPSKTTYTYGEVLDLTGLAVKITYADNGEVETVPYQYISLGGVQTTTFRRLGLTLHMGDVQGVEVQEGQQLSVPEHHRRFLYITGPQYGSSAVINDRSDVPLTINKKVLPLTASSITRRYGEGNGTYTYTFDPNDLVSWDRPYMGTAPAKGETDQLNTPAHSEALEKVNARFAAMGSAYAFEGPRFATAAVKKSAVRTAEYPLRLSGGTMANYEFTWTDAGITVEPRAISISKIMKEPLYTVSKNAFGSDMTPPTFSGVVVSSSGNDLEVIHASGESWKQTGDPVVEGDILTFKLGGSFDFKLNFNFNGQYEVPHDVSVQQAELISGGDNDNYRLVLPNNFNLKATGSVHQRVIKSIRVALPPNKMVYTYGEPLDLKGMLLEITYVKGNGPDTEMVNVDPTSMEEVYINYYPATWTVKDGVVTEGTPPDPSQWGTLINEHPVTSGDHLTIATDDDGFAHNGMYLMVTARTHDSLSFDIMPAVTRVPIVVNPRELTYTLSAEDKDYDHNREAQGTIGLTNVYGADKVWVVNGTDYTDEAANPLPDNYAFTSGDYHAPGGYDGVTFTFVDENVSYRLSDGHDMFQELQVIPVEVAGIRLDGHDAPNYSINTEVKVDTRQMEGRDGVPSAAILPIERPAPAVPTQLWVNEHTNTVNVIVGQEASEFGDELDQKNTLHYEYALVYRNEVGSLEITPFQDDPYFGGEIRTVEEVPFVPDPLSPGRDWPPVGQVLDPNDVLFNTEGRSPLPRDTWIGALVRIAKTNNYKVSPGQSSFDADVAVDEAVNNDREVLEALDTASRVAAAVVIPKPADDKIKLTERIKGNVIKTYTYRLDLISVAQEKDEDKNQIMVPTLEAVWFTDIAEYTRADDFSRLVESLEKPIYYSYYYDYRRNNSIPYPLRLDKEIHVKLADQNHFVNVNYNLVDTVVNANRTMDVIVTIKPSNAFNQIMPTAITISPRRLSMTPGQMAGLGISFDPYTANMRSITWSSSDNSVARVSINGVVTAVGPGTAIIRAISFDPDVWDAIMVQVSDGGLGGPGGGGAGGGGGEGGEGETPSVPQKPAHKPLPFEDSLFNAGYTGAFMELLSGNFYPERVVNRRELAVIMAHFLQEVEGREPGDVSTFNDIGNFRGNDAIYALSKWGIVNGVGEGRFSPNKAATRAEISVMLCRMLGLEVGTDPNVKHAFPDDADPAHSWAWAYINALAAAGITKGTSETTYSPERMVTRAEVAAFLSRAMVTVLDKDKGPLLVPKDVTEAHWGYQLILRAINGEPGVRLKDEYLLIEESQETEKSAGKQVKKDQK